MIKYIFVLLLIWASFAYAHRDDDADDHDPSDHYWGLDATLFFHTHGDGEGNHDDLEWNGETYTITTSGEDQLHNHDGSETRINIPTHTHRYDRASHAGTTVNHGSLMLAEHTHEHWHRGDWIRTTHSHTFTKARDASIAGHSEPDRDALSVSHNHVKLLGHSHSNVKHKTSESHAHPLSWHAYRHHHDLDKVEPEPEEVEPEPLVPTNTPIKHNDCYGDGEPHFHKMDTNGYWHGIDHTGLEFAGGITKIHTHPVCEEEPPEKEKPKRKPPTPIRRLPTEESIDDEKQTPLDDSEQPKDDDKQPPSVIVPDTEKPMDDMSAVDDKPKEDTPTEAPVERPVQPSHRDTFIDYQPCILKSKIIEGIQVTEYMTNYYYQYYEDDGRLSFEEVYPQWFEVWNATDDTINLNGAVLKYTSKNSVYDEDAGQWEQPFVDVEIDTDFMISAKSVGIIATLPPIYFRVWYNEGETEVMKKEVKPKINGVPYYYFNDTYDHNINLRNYWEFEFNGEIVFRSTYREGQTINMGDSCKSPSQPFIGKGLLYYSVKRDLHSDVTPGYYKKPVPAAPSKRRVMTTTWADLKKK